MSYDVCTGLMLPNAQMWITLGLFLFLFSVWLYHDRKFIGSGFLLGEQRQTIHGHPVAPDDIGIELEHVTELDVHPRYGYPLEAGSFTTWARADIDFNKY